MKYIPAHTKTRHDKRTVLDHNVKEICSFEVEGHFTDFESFNREYINSRKKLWKDSPWGKGDWSEELDLGYQNYRKVIELANYTISYYENKFDYRVPAKVRCCGSWLTLGKFTNTCESCQSDYNGSGQLLAPRRFWGEETGENWTDCI